MLVIFVNYFSGILKNAKNPMITKTSKKYLYSALILFLIAECMAQKPLFENSDFSKGNLLNWKLEGEDFSYTPATAAINPGWDVSGSETKDLAIRWDTRQEMYRQPELTQR